MISMTDIDYREAMIEDRADIAALHALSWQRHYRGIYSHQYLEHEVAGERLAVWTKRFAAPVDGQYLLQARHESRLIGFVCVFLYADPPHGALVDNLHVLQEYQGHGIGRQLLARAARWVRQQDPEMAVHLYVLEQNHPARRFYEQVGAQFSDLLEVGVHDGRIDRVFRCYWPEADQLTGAGH